jgi:hypothetical protein
MASDTCTVGLGEYYWQGDARTPTWLIVGDTQSIGQTTGLVVRPALNRPQSCEGSRRLGAQSEKMT